MGKKERKKSFDLSQMSVKEIVQAKDDVKLLLASLEDQHRKAEISDKAYKETKDKNQKKLEEVRTVLIDMGMRDIADKPPKELEEKKEPPSENQPVAQTAPAQATPAQSTTTPAQPGVQMPQPVQATQPSVNMELIETKLKAGTDRMSTVIDAVKESQKATDEKITRITESLGELRALIFGKESNTKDQVIRLEKLEEEMSGINPRKLEKEFGKRDKILTELSVDVDKLQNKMEIITRSMGEVQSTLRSVGNLENIATVNKDVMTKLREMQNISKMTDRMSDKVQKIFLDLNKKLELFMLYKSKQDTLDELSKELMKTVDGLSIKIEDYVEKRDLRNLQDDIYGVGNKIEDMRKIIDVIIPVIDLKMPESIKELQKKKESVEGIIMSLEKSYRDERISKEDYLSAKEKNEKALGDIQKKLKKEWEHLQEMIKQGKSDEIKPKQVEQSKPKEKKEEPKEEKPKAEEKPTNKPEEKKEQYNPEEKPIEKKEETKPEEKKEQPKEEKSSEKPEEKKEDKPAEKPEEKKESVTKKVMEKKEDPEIEGLDEATKQLLADLKDSLDKGLLSKDAYEASKKTILESVES